MTRDVEDPLLGVVEGAADIEALPGAGHAQARRALVEGLPQGERRARERHRPIRHQRGAEHSRDLEGCELDRAALHPGHLTRRRRDEPAGRVEDLIEGAPRALARGERLQVVVAGDLTDRGPRRVPHGRERQQEVTGSLAIAALLSGRLGEPLRRLLQVVSGRRADELACSRHRLLHRSRRQLEREGRGHPIDEFVGLIDDDRVVIGQHGDALDRMDGEHRVVGDHDVGLHGDLAALGREAVRAVGALHLAHALPARHRQASPDTCVDRLAEFVAVARLGLEGPGAHGSGLLAELGPRNDRVAVVVGLLTVQALQAHVVVPTLEHGVGERSRQQRLQCLGHDGEVPLRELALERKGRRRDDDRVALHRVQGGRDEIRKRLARAGPRLDEQVLGHLPTGVQRLGHRLGHGELPRARLAAEGSRGRSKRLLDAREGVAHRSSGSGSVTPRRAARSGRTRARRRVPSARCSCDSTSPSSCAAATRSPRS